MSFSVAINVLVNDDSIYFDVNNQKVSPQLPSSNQNSPAFTATPVSWMPRQQNLKLIANNPLGKHQLPPLSPLSIGEASNQALKYRKVDILHIHDFDLSNFVKD